MTDGNRGRPGQVGFDKGLLAGTSAETAQMIEAWFDDVDYKNYVAGYRKLALSGTTGALEALAKQQVGRTTKPGDTVDAATFFADAWLSSMTNAWTATRDINQQFVDDLSRFLGSDVPSRPQRTAAKKATKKGAATRARPATKKKGGTAGQGA
jgi:hypothetical protein